MAHKDTPVNKVLLDQKAKKDHQDLRGQQDHKGQWDQKVAKVSRGLVEFLDRKDCRDLTETMEFGAKKEIEGTLAHQDLRDRQDHQENAYRADIMASRRLHNFTKLQTKRLSLTTQVKT